MGRILVVGSMNMDIINRVNKHPLLGETIHGKYTTFSSGGKGANQAIAAARSGAEVYMAGSVGDDFFGSEIRRLLSKDEVSSKYIQTKQETTGVAVITIDDGGENSIILSKGANGKYIESDLEGVEFAQYDAILLQNEIPWKTNAFILEKTSRLGVRTFFNPAPALRINKQYLSLIDVLILNEVEANEMSELPVGNIEEAYLAAQALVQQGIAEVVITLGKQGSLYVNCKGEKIFSPAFCVNTVDTTAAGDTFIGTFSNMYTSGLDIEASLRYASAAAALTVMFEGAQESIPTSQQVITFIQKGSELG